MHADVKKICVQGLRNASFFGKFFEGPKWMIPSIDIVCMAQEYYYERLSLEN